VQVLPGTGVPSKYSSSGEMEYLDIHRSYKATQKSICQRKLCSKDKVQIEQAMHIVRLS